MQLELTDEERGLLGEVLRNVLSDLSVEIADTDRKAFRDQLKTRRAAIEKLLAAIRAQ